MKKYIVTQKELSSLLEDSWELQKLKACGVDNWEGMSFIEDEEDDIPTSKYIEDNFILDDSERTISIMEKYLELIYDLGYDYDGLKSVASLKKLIEELCTYASLGRERNVTETIFVNGETKYNILGEKIKERNGKK